MSVVCPSSSSTARPRKRSPLSSRYASSSSSPALTRLPRTLTALTAHPHGTRAVLATHLPAAPAMHITVELAHYADTSAHQAHPGVLRVPAFLAHWPRSQRTPLARPSPESPRQRRSLSCPSCSRPPRALAVLLRAPGCQAGHSFHKVAMRTRKVLDCSEPSAHCLASKKTNRGIVAIFVKIWHTIVLIMVRSGIGGNQNVNQWLGRDTDLFNGS